MKKITNNIHVYFSRQERRSLLVFILLASSFLGMLYAIYHYEKPVKLTLEEVLIRNSGTKNPEVKSFINQRLQNKKRLNNKGKNPVLFSFDPNHISADSLQLLGIDKKTISTFLKYRHKIGKFKNKDQVFKVYGMEKYRNILIEHINFHEQNRNLIALPDTAQSDDQTDSDNRWFNNNIPTVKIQSININEADSFQWQLIKGIGPRLANRIVRYKDRLGGFYEIEQIEEVYGLRPETFLAISHMLTVNAADIKKLNINHSPVDVLASHPYIGRKKAAVLLRYVQHKGPLKSADDLIKSRLFDADEVDKLLPYLDFR